MTGPRRHPDAGVTLIELTVSMFVMSLVMVAFLSTLTSAMNSSGRLQRSTEAVDEARLVSARLDRELRSAECISAPAENMAGNTLVFRTLADGEVETITYRVSAGHVTRQEGLGAEHVIITNVGTSTNAFEQVVTPLRTVRVRIPIRSANGGTFSLETTIAGRNAWRSC
ncbi:MAG: type II secretion system protein J [Acidimicrobiia bacterium]